MKSLNSFRSAGQQAAARGVTWAIALAMLAGVEGCSTPKSFIARSAENSGAGRLPHKILLVPPEVSVIEVTIGGVTEKDSDWSRQAKDNIVAALRSQAANCHVELIELPELSQDEKDTLDRHVAMFEVVAASASQYALSTDSTWKKLAPGLHYTVGPGLRFLTEKTGADAAMIVSAEDAVSTNGRLAVIAATILIFGVPVLPPGYSFLAAGLVDLRTGDLLWHDFDWNIARRDLRRGPDAAGLVSDVFDSFPQHASAQSVKP
jgi:hypothetical protein